MEGTITINLEQLENMLKDKEYAKEWKASRFNDMVEESLKIKQEIKEITEQKEYWENEMEKLQEKVELYRNKYLKWKKKTKKLDKNGQKKENKQKECFKCGKIGHIAKNCRTQTRRNLKQNTENITCNNCRK